MAAWKKRSYVDGRFIVCKAGDNDDVGDVGEEHDLDELRNGLRRMQVLANNVMVEAIDSYDAEHIKLKVRRCFGFRGERKEFIKFFFYAVIWSLFRQTI